MGSTPATLAIVSKGKSMRAYYAHCQSIYRTPQEYRDLNLLGQLGFDIVNPSEVQHSKRVEEMKSRGENVMLYFEMLVESCDVLAFRALPDGRIPAGVAKEIEKAKSLGRAIIELPSGILSRTMSLNETCEYLAEAGQR